MGRSVRPRPRRDAIGCEKTVIRQTPRVRRVVRSPTAEHWSRMPGGGNQRHAEQAMPLVGTNSTRQPVSLPARREALEARYRRKALLADPCARRKGKRAGACRSPQSQPRASSRPERGGEPGSTTTSLAVPAEPDENPTKPVGHGYPPARLLRPVDPGSPLRSGRDDGAVALHCHRAGQITASRLPRRLVSLTFSR